MAVDQATLDQVLAEADRRLDANVDRLFEFLRIPSVSTDPSYAAECRAAAAWVRAELTSLGFEAEIVGAPSVPDGAPSVLARDPAGPEGRRRALFYGHYDVQPVDPVELWSRPPFEPTLIDLPNGRKAIQARGASDDKGQVMTFVEACRAWRAVAGREPVAVSFLIEGEEESGSPSFAEILDVVADRIAADICLVCDTTMWGARPAITASLRGMAGGGLAIRAASRDLHSGIYGSAARNPLHVLARILADLRDPSGRVTLDGFYDGVDETPPEIRAAWEGLGLTDAAFLGPIGLSERAGETDRSLLEQVWARPTAEVNGVGGGYDGPGGKTVIPAEARAKLTFRLVGRQDPDAVWAAFEAHARARVPADCTIEFERELGAYPLAQAYDSPMIRQAAAALEAEWGAETVVVGGGGSIPAVVDISRRLGQEALLIGFAHDDDNVHSPDEKYDLESFRKGVRSWIRVLAALAEEDPA